MYIDMSVKLTRVQLKGLTAEEKLEFQRKQNAERVTRYRAKNKEKADKYNREYNRPENRGKYNELNKRYVEKYRNQLKQVNTLIAANKNADKSRKNANEAKKTIEEGKAIMRRLTKK